MRKKGILLALLVLALTMTAAVASAECAHASWNWHMEHDQTAHWRVCDDCGEIAFGPEKHDAWCDMPDLCAVCGATGVTMDRFLHQQELQEWRITETTHEKVCTNCGQIVVESAEHMAICYEPGVCMSCRASDVILVKTLHVRVHWEHDHTSHWSMCDICGEVASKPEAHYTNEGDPAGICSKCGASYTPAPAPVHLNGIAISGDQSVGGSVTATVSATGATYYSYWVYNGQCELVSEAYMTTSNTYSFIPAKPGIYNVFVTVSDGLTTAQDNSGWFPVKGDPVVINGLTVSGGRKAGSPLTATINATGATGFSFWFYDANGTLLQEAYMVTTSSYTFTPPTAGGYNIFVAVTDGVSGAQTNSGWFLVE